MEFEAGDQVRFRLLPDTTYYRATVLSIDEDTIALRTGDDRPPAVLRGMYLVISEPETEMDYYTEVLSQEQNILRLKRMWTGKRGYFRVDDSFPLIVRKVADDLPFIKSRIFSGYGAEESDIDAPDEGVSPRLWMMMVDINAKLGLILEKLHLESEGLVRAENKTVNISASGVRFTIKEKFNIGDLLEIKMLLPLYPAVGIVTYGNVVRMDGLQNGEYEIALHFAEMDNEVMDVIIQYTLKRQREMIRKQRRWGAAA